MEGRIQPQPANTAAIRVGVVGLGYFGSRHARHYAANGASRLIALADADPARAVSEAEKYGAEAHADHRALIGKVDAVSIVVPTTLHHEVARDFIDAGVHVLIEKPIAASPQAAEDLVARAQKAGTVLQVGHIERFAPAFVALKERVTDPRLIECVRRTVWSGRAADVDVVLDLMIHDIDLALTLAGAPVAEVAASGASVMTGLNDVAEARLAFSNGVVATLAASRVAPRGERKLFVSEPQRHFCADLAGPSLTEFSAGRDGGLSETVELPPSDNLQREIAAFLDSVANRKPAVVDGKAGLDALAVAERIVAAIAAQRVQQKNE
jgi:predicted dehydrogenase